jgi:hypothetical protein
MAFRPLQSRSFAPESPGRRRTQPPSRAAIGREPVQAATNTQTKVKSRKLDIRGGNRLQYSEGFLWNRRSPTPRISLVGSEKRP